MGPLVQLLLLATTMAGGSFAAGVLPLHLALSDAKIQLTSALGAGLILGTALAVIVPEGVHSLDAQRSAAIGPALLLGFVTMFIVEQFQRRFFRSLHQPSTHTDCIGLAPLTSDRVDDQQALSPIEVRCESRVGSPVSLSKERLDDDSRQSQSTPIVDQHRLPISDPFGDNNNVSTRSRSPPTRRHASAKLSPTLGLIVHSLSDGMALGAAAAVSRAEENKKNSLEVTIFLAILLHKAPSAFGLATFLQHLGYRRRRITKHLIAFSSAAPVAAIITYIALIATSVTAATVETKTGILLLFSAGSFLFVAAVHILPEITHGGHDHSQILTLGQTLLLILGMIIPLFINIDHDH